MRKKTIQEPTWRTLVFSWGVYFIFHSDLRVFVTFEKTNNECVKSLHWLGSIFPENNLTMIWCEPLDFGGFQHQRLSPNSIHDVQHYRSIHNQFSPFRQKWSIRLNSMCATRIFSGTIKTKSRKKISIDGLSEFQWNGMKLRPGKSWHLKRVLEWPIKRILTRTRWLRSICDRFVCQRR